MATILVTGSTGTIGAATVQALSGMPGVTVRAGVHSRPAQQPGGVETVEVDYERPETVRDAAAGVDAVFMVTPPLPNQDELAGRLLEALVAARVPRVVRLSAMGADTGVGGAFMHAHGRTERQIAESGIPATVLRPNSFMSNFVAFNPPDQDGNIVIPWGDAGISLVDPRDVGNVAAQVLTSDAHVGRSYNVTGPEAITVAQIASTIAHVTGREVRYVDVPPEAMRQGMLGFGLPEPMVDAVLQLWEANRSGATAHVTGVVEEITGRPGRTFAEFARDHAGAWQQA
jgi:uncharacterized protein YbjT (DUF2867 family)